MFTIHNSKALVVLFVLLVSSPAYATHIYVDAVSGSDVTGDGTWGDAYKTIAKGIDGAGYGDTVWLLDGTYTGTGNVNIDFDGNNFVLRSKYGADNCIIDCGGADNRAFEFKSGESANAKLLDLTLKNGDVTSRVIDFVADKNGGLVKIYGSSPSFEDCIFDNGEALVGGAVAIWHSSTNCVPTFTNCTFKNNTSSTYGGGINCAGHARATIEECTFHDNVAGSGGGINQGNNSLAKLIIDECVFYDNYVSGTGGAVHIDDSATITSSTFVDNNAGTGSGVAVGGNGVLVFTQNIVAFNDADGMRAGTASPDVTMSCNDFYSNVGGSFTGYLDSTDYDSSEVIFEDPLFCDLDNDDFTISDLGPCDDDSSFCDALIGRYDTDCSWCCNLPGDCDNSGQLDISDVVYIVDYMFTEGPPAPCPAEMNVDGIGGIDISDMVYLVDFMHTGGAAPVCPSE